MVVDLKKKFIVPTGFIEQREAKVEIDAYKMGDIPDEVKRRRYDAEFYEHQMINERVWSEQAHWTVDGISDKFGRVDVKTIGLDKTFLPAYEYKPWWNIDATKMRNICRQYNKIDHFYFIKFGDRPMRSFEVGDEVEFEFLGVLTYQQVMSQIQVSKGKNSKGHYIDTRKASKTRGMDDMFGEG